MAERIIVRAEFQAVVESFQQELRATRRDIDRVARGIGTTNSQLRTFQNRLDTTGRSLRRLAGAFIGIGLVDGVSRLASGFVETADALALAEGQLDVVAGRLGLTEEAYEAVYQISQRTRTEFVSNVAQFARLSSAARLTRDNFEDLKNAMESFNLAAIISGSTAEETRATYVQLTQALGSGALQGQELRSVAEQNLRLARVLREYAEERGFRTLFGQRGAGAAGIFTSDVVIELLRNELPRLRQEFEKLPVTISSAFQVLRNSAGQAIRVLNSLFDVNRRVARSLLRLNESVNEENILNVALAFRTWTQNIREMFEPMRGFLELLGGMTTGINTLAFAIQALPFFALARVLTGAARGVSAFFGTRAGRRLLREREYRRLSKTLERPLTGNERRAVNGVKKYREELTEAIPNIDEYSRRIFHLQERFKNLGETLATVDQYSLPVFLGGLLGAGALSSIGDYNALTRQIEKLRAGYQTLDPFIANINRRLGRQGRIYDEVIQRIREMTDAEKEAFAEAETIRITKGRQRYAELAKEVEGLNASLDEARQRQKEVAERPVQSGRAGAVERQQRRQELAVIQERIEQIQLLIEQNENLRRSLADSGVLEELTQIEQAAADASKEVVTLGRSLGALERILRRRPLNLGNVFARGGEVSRAFEAAARQQRERFGNLFEAKPFDFNVRVGLGSGLREEGLEERLSGFQERTRQAYFQWLNDSNERMERWRQDVEAFQARQNASAEQFRQEVTQERIEIRQRKLNESATQYNRTLQITTNFLSTINTQILSAIEGTQSWADAFRALLNQIVQTTTRLAVVEPLARKITDAIHPEGRQALDSLSDRFIGQIRGAGGNRIIEGARLFSSTENTFNIGTPAIEWGIRRSQARNARRAIGVAFDNPGAW